MENFFFLKPFIYNVLALLFISHLFVRDIFGIWVLRLLFLFHNLRCWFTGSHKCKRSFRVLFGLSATPLAASSTTSCSIFATTRIIFFVIIVFIFLTSIFILFIVVVIILLFFLIFFVLFLFSFGFIITFWSLLLGFLFCNLWEFYFLDGDPRDIEII